MKDTHKTFPARCSHAERSRNAMSGRQAYNVYLSKHDLGKGTLDFHQMLNHSIKFHYQIHLLKGEQLFPS